MNENVKMNEMIGANLNPLNAFIEQDPFESI